MQLVGHGGDVLGMAFSPDGSSVASCSFDRTILLWRTYDECENYMMLRGHKNAVTQVRGLHKQWFQRRYRAVACTLGTGTAAWLVEVRDPAHQSIVFAHPAKQQARAGKPGHYSVHCTDCCTLVAARAHSHCAVHHLELARQTFVAAPSATSQIGKPLVMLFTSVCGDAAASHSKRRCLRCLFAGGMVSKRGAAGDFFS
jgi:hypothetical protein